MSREPDRVARCRSTLLGDGTTVVAVASAILQGMGGSEFVALAIPKQTNQQARGDGFHACPTALIVAVELGLHLVPKLARNDGLMLTRMTLALVADLTDVDTVAQDLVESTA